MPIYQKSWIGSRRPVQSACSTLSIKARRLAAAGGEDYELLCTLAPESLEAARAGAKAAGVELTEIGRVEEGSGVSIREADGRELQVPGFDHLR